LQKGLQNKMPTFKSSIGNRDNISLDHVCKLISITTTQDSIGQFIKSKKERTIFCSKMSITRAEFNTAGNLGHKPTLMLIVDGDEYGKEQYLEFENVQYSIYKTFQRADNFTELYCEVKAGD
jgi:SPP1 family predicted phage head-tail adaptor